MSICGATDIPVLDFWWHLLWVSKPEVGSALFKLCGGVCGICSLICRRIMLANKTKKVVWVRNLVFHLSSKFQHKLWKFWLMAFLIKAFTLPNPYFALYEKHTSKFLLLKKLKRCPISCIKAGNLYIFRSGTNFSGQKVCWKPRKQLRNQESFITTVGWKLLFSLSVNETLVLLFVIFLRNIQISLSLKFLWCISFHDR